MKNIIAATILGVSIIITAKIFCSSASSIVTHMDDNQLERTLRDDKYRYQIEIITDKGKNWNGIYILDRSTGKVKFYVSPEDL